MTNSKNIFTFVVTSIIRSFVQSLTRNILASGKVATQSQAQKMAWNAARVRQAIQKGATIKFLRSDGQSVCTVKNPSFYVRTKPSTRKPNFTSFVFVDLDRPTGKNTISMKLANLVSIDK